MLLLKLVVVVGFVLTLLAATVDSWHEVGQNDFYITNAFPVIVDRIQLTNALARETRLRGFSPWDILIKIEEFKHWLTDRSNATRCGFDFLNFVVALVEMKPWAVAMVDSFGKLGSGVTQGNLAWAGDYGLCRGISATPAINISFFMPFETQYCWLSFKLAPELMSASDAGNLSMQYPLRTSICVPDTCSLDELRSMTEVILGLMPTVGNLLNFTDVTCVPKEQNLWKDGSTVAAFVVCCVFIVLLLVATFYDVYFKGKRRLSHFEYNNQCNSDEHLDAGHSNSVNNKKETSDDCKIEEDKAGSNASIASIDSRRQPNVPVIKSKTEIAEDLLVSFSMYTNGKKILSLSPGKESITVINGIRFFSMTWVILGHTFMLGCSNLDNIAVLLNVTQTFLFQVVAQGVLAVDTFFLLSGLLVAYLFLKEFDRNDGKISWFRFYFHRLWRLTPPYMLVLFLFNMRLSKYFSSGPFWPADGFSGSCEKNWWWNLLYINNFNKLTDMCMGWTWYLSNDMQFFIISPLILIPMAKRSIPITSIVAGSFLLACSICIGAITTYYGLSAGFDITAMSAGSTEYETMFDQLYTKPYTRIGPYIIGMLCGWLLHRCKCRANLKTHWVVVGWLAAVALALTVVVGTFHAHPIQGLSSLYNSLAKIAWSLSLCWVIFACATGYGGFVNHFLSWPAWNPLSRLTYMAYLWHYILLMAVFYSVEVPMHFSYTFFILYYLALVLVTYIGALIFSLAFESPFLGLERVMFRR